jgi:hypothetical protein
MSPASIVVLSFRIVVENLLIEHRTNGSGVT